MTAGRASAADREFLQQMALLLPKLDPFRRRELRRLYLELHDQGCEVVEE